jgi:NADH dehydrogenase FAD-containing subunit
MARTTEQGEPTRIVIVGGGVAGVACARELAERGLRNVHIRLINASPYLEYHGALYRVVAGSSPLEVCIPLRDIFSDTDVEVVYDTVDNVVTDEQHVWGVSGSRYEYDYLVLALGSQTDYFGIEGMQEHAFQARTVSQALNLKRHLSRVISRAAQHDDKEKHLKAAHIAVVGAGATGTELAGELSRYTQRLCANHRLDPSYVTIELIEAAPHVLPKLPRFFSRVVEGRLRECGVNILTNRMVERVDPHKVHISGMEMEASTVIWCAGVKANELYSQFFETNKKGAVEVNQFMQPHGLSNVFIAGDGAATAHAGYAQTALQDGAYIAETLERIQNHEALYPHTQRAPVDVIPVGNKWAAALLDHLVFYGRTGWWIRRLADLKLYLSLMPVSKAFDCFKSGASQWRRFRTVERERQAEQQIQPNNVS